MYVVLNIFIIYVVDSRNESMLKVVKWRGGKPQVHVADAPAMTAHRIISAQLEP